MLKQNLAQFRYLLEPALAAVGIGLIGSSLISVASMVIRAVTGQ